MENKELQAILARTSIPDHRRKLNQFPNLLWLDRNIGTVGLTPDELGKARKIIVKLLEQ